jgi:hypothetical protein
MFAAVYEIPISARLVLAVVGIIVVVVLSVIARLILRSSRRLNDDALPPDYHRHASAVWRDGPKARRNVQPEPGVAPAEHDETPPAHDARPGPNDAE